MSQRSKLREMLDFMTTEAWARYQQYWANADFKARSMKASQNRLSEKEGSSTGISIHTGETRPFRVYAEVLAHNLEEGEGLTFDDVFLHLHTQNHDRKTFVDGRSVRLHVEIERRREELTQATPDQLVDEMQLYYDVLGDCLKVHVYGLGSYCSKKRRFGDPGASTSHRSSPSRG